MRGARRLEQRRVEPAQPLHLAPRQFRQLGDGVLEDVVADARLDVGRLRLHRLVAHRGKLAELIGHAAELAAHAIGAGLAGIVRGERLGRFADADAPDRIGHIEDFPGAATNGARAAVIVNHSLVSLPAQNAPAAVAGQKKNGAGGTAPFRLSGHLGELCRISQGARGRPGSRGGGAVRPRRQN